MATSGPVLIMGDFNRPDINWLSLTSSSLLSNIFCDFVFDNNLSQLVQEPTHSKNNCLDLILSNSPDNVGPIDIAQNSLIQSDHFMLSFVLWSPIRSPSKPPTISRCVPDLSKLNYSDLAQHLFDTDFSECLLSSDANHIWSRLNSIINYYFCGAIDSLAPKVKLRSRNINPPWFDSRVRHQLHCVKSLRKKYSQKPSSCNRNKLGDAERSLFELMRAAKSSYESQLVDHFAFNNSYKIFKYIKSIMKTDSLPVVMHLNDKSATSDLDKAELFNLFFESVYSKDNVSPDFTTIPQFSQSETL